MSRLRGACPAVGLARRDRRRLVRRSGRGSRAAMVGAVHHGRRAHLLGARAQLRGGRRLPRPRRATPAAYSVVYPLLISPAYALFDSLPDAYAAAKTINALCMSLAAIPAYLLARRVLAPPLSLVAALLTVARARRSSTRAP